VEYERFTYPAHDAPLVEAYDGLFESAYILFHPFVRVPDALAWRATRKYPSDEQILRLGAKCSWAHVAAQTGLPASSKLNQALLTSIRAINNDLCDFKASEALQRYLVAESIWMPSEGCFEPLLQADFLAAFEAAAQSELVFVPEFPASDPIQRLNIAQLKRREIPFPSRGTLVAPDASFLFSVDWDSFFTLFYGPRAFLDKLVHRQNLEGFFATQTTAHFWFNYLIGCSAFTISPEIRPAL
jgi:hypothetical protein